MVRRTGVPASLGGDDPSVGETLPEGAADDYVSRAQRLRAHALAGSGDKFERPFQLAPWSETAGPGKRIEDLHGGEAPERDGVLNAPRRGFEAGSHKHLGEKSIGVSPYSLLD